MDAACRTNVDSFLYGKGPRHFVTIRGKTLVWKVKDHISAVKNPKRGACGINFNSSTRMRLLKVTNAIDWEKSLPGLFLTLTYGDDIDISSYTKTSLHRQVFWRYIEKHLDRRCPALWRLEWKPRQTGTKVNHLFPHFHLLVLKTPYINKDTIKDLWRKTIKQEGEIITWVERIESAKSCGAYVAKYVGKIDVVLDIDAYHNNPTPGRQWGILRSALIPWGRVGQTLQIENERIRAIHAEATAGLKKFNCAGTESFTILGDRALHVYEKLVKAGLATAQRKK